MAQIMLRCNLGKNKASLHRTCCFSRSIGQENFLRDVMSDIFGPHYIMINAREPCFCPKARSGDVMERFFCALLHRGCVRGPLFSSGIRARRCNGGAFWPSLHHGRLRAPSFCRRALLEGAMAAIFVHYYTLRCSFSSKRANHVTVGV